MRCNLRQSYSNDGSLSHLDTESFRWKRRERVLSGKKSVTCLLEREGLHLPQDK